MSNKAPIKIYISEDSAKRLLPSNGISVGLKPLFEDDISYILESEHNRIVLELKKERDKYNELYVDYGCEIDNLQLERNKLESQTKELQSEHERIVETLKNRIRVLEKLIPQVNEIKSYDGENLSSSEMGKCRICGGTDCDSDSHK